MGLFVHYDGKTGKIWQINKARRPHERAGMKVACVHPSKEPDLADTSKQYFVDVSSVEMGENGWDYCTILARDAEIDLSDIQNIRYEELRLTDPYMLEDFPITPEEKQAWRAYRQAIRDMGELPNARAMLAAWPDRPDGNDPTMPVRIKYKLPAKPVQSIAR